MNTPKVTILMPVYNGEKYLKEAIDSILGQTFSDFEFLIIDDGSTDDSARVIRSYSDPRIRLITNEKNLKLIASLNKGLQLARGELIARMDADDVSLPERLEKEVDFLEHHPDHVLVGTASDVVDEKGRLTFPYYPFVEDAVLRMALALGNAFTHGSVLFRKEAALKVGGYSSDLFSVEDYDFWIKLARLGKISNLPQKLYHWRDNSSGVSARNRSLQEKTAKRIARDHWDSFGPKGAAPPERWKRISFEEEMDEEARLALKKRLVRLHLKFAREYFRRKNPKSALFHFWRAGRELLSGFFQKTFFQEMTGRDSLQLAIGILFFEKVEQTIECVDSFCRPGVPIRILNNGSSAESRKILGEHCAKYPEVEIFDSEKNLGVSGGRNFLISHSGEPWLLFVDNDITTGKADFLEKIRHHVRMNPQIEVFIPRLWNTLEKRHSLQTSFRIKKGRLVRDWNIFKKNINAFPGGAAFIRRSLFERLGSFDERMFVGFEDFELAARAIKAGRPVRARKIGDIEFIHDHRVAVKEADRQSVLVRYDEEKHRISSQVLKEKHGLVFEDDWQSWLAQQVDLLARGRSYEKGWKDWFFFRALAYGCRRVRQSLGGK